eukprot:3047301-Prymnesium_polylepis.1
MYVKSDRHGFYTDLYDKRTAMAAAGQMGEVRRYPHVESKLTESCKYNTRTGFLHRIHRIVTRRSRFAEHASERVANMCSHGYKVQKLLETVRKSILNNYLPRSRRQAMNHKVKDKALRKIVQLMFERRRAQAVEEARAAAAVAAERARGEQSSSAQRKSRRGSGRTPRGRRRAEPLNGSQGLNWPGKQSRLARRSGRHS